MNFRRFLIYFMGKLMVFNQIIYILFKLSDLVLTLGLGFLRLVTEVDVVAY